MIRKTRRTAAGYIGLCTLALSPIAQADTAPVLLEKYRTVCSDVFNGALGEGDLSLIASAKVIAELKAAMQNPDIRSTAQHLGNASSLRISDVTHLANADAFLCEFTHANGKSEWTLGYSPLSHVVEGAEVVFAPKPAPGPAPASRATPESQPTSRPSPPEVQAQSEPQGQRPPAPEQSAACRKFPDLC
tara:strand:+ start:12646 stop:13212 length:567 start_codon:yes stop_codon:yes gene_type:complete